MDTIELGSDQNRAPGRSRSGWLHLTVLLGFVLLTLVMTLPLVFHLRTHIAGVGGDSFCFLWTLWWVKKAILDPSLSVFYTDFLYYPVGVTLAFHTLSLANSVLSIPFQSFLGLTGAYNAMILLGFILGGWGAYLLAYSLTGNRIAAIFAGIAFGFSPYHFSRAMVDLNTASIHFIPFTFLFLIRWRRRGGLVDPALAGLFLGITGLCCWYYLLYTSMAVALIGLVWLFQSGRPKHVRSAVLGSLLLGLVALAVISPAVMPMVKAVVEGTDFMNPGRQEAYSADLLAYVVPSSNQPLFLKWVAPYYRSLGGNVYENTVSLGLVVIALAAYGVWGRRRAGGDRLAWAIVGLVAFVLSLGPTLQIAGRSIGQSGWLPYRWLIQDIPLISHARVPSRIAVLVTCSVSVLGAFGFRDLLGCKMLRASRWRKMGWVSLVFTVLLVELWGAPVPGGGMPVPHFFEEVAEDDDDYTVLGLPFKGWTVALQDMYYQTTHGKRIVNGLVARTPVGADAFFDEWSRAASDYGFLQRHRVRYIFLHASLGPEPWHVQTMDGLSQLPWLRRLDLDEPGIIVYAVQ